MSKGSNRVLGVVAPGQRYQDQDPRCQGRVGTVLKVGRKFAQMRWDHSGLVTRVALKRLESQGTRGYLYVGEAKEKPESKPDTGSTPAKAPPKKPRSLPTSAEVFRCGWSDGRRLWRCFICRCESVWSREWRLLVFGGSNLLKHYEVVVCSEACAKEARR